jgi:hypothetical protein
MERDRFHGRVRGRTRTCAYPECTETGEFRAPNPFGRTSGFDGPGDWQWLCLEHVRAFNAKYNFFDGMTREEIEEAQMPVANWAATARIFSPAGPDAPPKWADFHDPLDAISARFKDGVSRAQKDGRMLPKAEQDALKALGLSAEIDKKAIRAAYSGLVRRYHPDRNGGDRSHEKKLQKVVEAYQLLKTSPHFP